MKRLFKTLLVAALVLGGMASVPLKADRKVLAADYSKKRIAIVDADKKILWEHPVKQIHDLRQLPNGNILFQTSCTKLVEMTPEKEIVWQYDSAVRNGNKGKKVEVHAFQRLENGVTMIAESGTSRIIEVNKKGKILHEIPLKVKDPHPHRDTRMVRRTPSGTYLVCHEAEGKVSEYGRDGRIVWEYEVPMFGKKPQGGHGLEAFGNAVYGAIRLKNGNTLVATGNGHSVLEVTPEKEIVWSIHQDDLEGIRLAWVTTLEELPNGNFVVGNCHAGPENPQILEINRKKQVVWSYKDFDNFGNALPCSQVID